MSYPTGYDGKKNRESAIKKSKKSRQSPQLKFSVAWRKPEHWSRLRDISAVWKNLERTYGDWPSQAEKARADFAGRGGYPEKTAAATLPGCYGGLSRAGERNEDRSDLV